MTFTLSPNITKRPPGSSPAQMSKCERSRRHLIIYARAPRYARVKTRLARDIGNIETLRFYRNTLQNISRRLMTMENLSFSIAITPDIDQKNTHISLLRGIPLMAQGSGNLGIRMTNTFANLGPGPAIIIGSDIPDINPNHINNAFRQLGENDAVFGPSKDGGYWLVGLKRRQPAPPGFMNNVRWSSEHALADTITTLPKSWKVSYINHLNDIDDGKAFKTWKAHQKK